MTCSAWCVWIPWFSGFGALFVIRNEDDLEGIGDSARRLKIMCICNIYIYIDPGSPRSNKEWSLEWSMWRIRYYQWAKFPWYTYIYIYIEFLTTSTHSTSPFLLGYVPKSSLNEANSRLTRHYASQTLFFCKGWWFIWSKSCRIDCSCYKICDSELTPFEMLPFFSFGHRWNSLIRRRSFGIRRGCWIPCDVGCTWDIRSKL